MQIVDFFQCAFTLYQVMNLVISLATVISTKKTEIWTNQMKVIQCLMSAQEQKQNYVDCRKTHDQFPDQLFWFWFQLYFHQYHIELLC